MAGPMPSRGPWSNTAGAVYRYAFVLSRGGTLEEAEAAAAQWRPKVGMDEVSLQARSALAAGYALSNPDIVGASEGYHSEAVGASQPGATELVATVRVLHKDAAGNERWSTVQVPLSPSASYADALTEVQLRANQLAEGPESRYAGTLIDWQVETVIGHIPGGG